MKEILKDKDKMKGWYLNVEGYEDCALLNESRQIMSLHQAKCYKAEKRLYLN